MVSAHLSQRFEIRQVICRKQYIWNNCLPVIKTMKRTICLLLTGLIAALQAESQVLCIYCFDQTAAISPEAENMVYNGSFEDGCGLHEVFCPGSLEYACDISGWLCTGGGNYTYASMGDSLATVVPDGLLAAYFGNDYCLACAGTESDTACLIQHECQTAGIPDGYPVNTPDYGDTSGISLQQTVSGLVAGNYYVLEFWTGGENPAPWVNDGLFAIDIGFGRTFLRCPSTAPPDATGRRYLIEFIATGTSCTIRFTNWGHISYESTELILDDIRLYTADQLPESAPNCFPVGWETQETPAFKISPNPFQNNICFSASTNSPTCVSVFNMESQKIACVNFNGITTIPATDWSPGIYGFIITQENGNRKHGILVKN